MFLDKTTNDKDDDEVNYILEMIDIFKCINTVLQQDDGTDVEFCNNVCTKYFFITTIKNIYIFLSFFKLPQLCKHHPFYIICFLKVDLRLILTFYYTKA